jgi:hypothetical protein
MPDAIARAVEALCRKLPAGCAYRHQTTTRSAELAPGSRTDLSWISTEAVDRAGEVVAAGGMDDSQFALNPLVTLNHDYTLPPVGRSLWRRRFRDGVKAKTHYPPRPASLASGEGWPPDQAFALIQAGLLAGKSIGFLPLATHIPDEREVKRRGWPDHVRLVIDRWLLLEYACVSLPANPQTLVESVSKSTPLAAFTTLTEVRACVQRRVASLDVRGLASRAVADAVARARGRV